LQRASAKTTTKKPSAGRPAFLLCHPPPRRRLAESCLTLGELPEKFAAIVPCLPAAPVSVFGRFGAPSGGEAYKPSDGLSQLADRRLE
jgi:hypothetical protein